MITAWVSSETICGDNPPALPELPPITRRTRKPVRLIGHPQWSDRALAGMVELYRSDKANVPSGHADTDATQEGATR